MTTAEIGAILATVLLAGLAVFQAALAAGAPLGHLAWGGANRVLPIGFRVASAAAIPLYAAIALVLLDRAAVIDLFPDGFVRPAAWVAFGYFCLGVVLNLASRSAPERLVMTPLVTALAVAAFLVARG
ncbi:MAG: hypothetical protein AB7O56_13695 [Bauldia sp.]